MLQLCNFTSIFYCLFIFVILLLQIYQISEQYQIAYSRMSVIHRLADITKIITTLIFVTVCLICENVIYKDSKLQSLKFLQKIDRFLNVHSENNTIHLLLKHKRLIIIAHIVFIISVLCNTYTYLYVLMDKLQIFQQIFDLLYHYKMLIFTIKLHIYCNLICERYTILNNRFESIVINIISKNDTNNDAVVDYMKYHSILCLMLRKCIKIYGMQMYLLYQIIVYSIVQFTYISWLGLFQYKHFDYEQIISKLFWTSYFLMIGVIVSYAGGNLNKQANSMVVLCHNLLSNYENRLDRNTIIYRILTQFSKQVAQMQPKFIIADYFLIDYDTVFRILQSVINYIIIYAQFE